MMMVNLYSLRRAALSPFSWSIGTRRLFLITFPVALPAWILLIAVLSTVISLLDAIRPIVNFWNAPPKRLRYSYSPYGVRRHYRTRGGKTAKENPAMREPAVEPPARKREMELASGGSWMPRKDSNLD